MEMIIKTIDTEKLPGYKRLLTEEYWKISDEQFPVIIEEVIENVKAGDLKLIEIVKLFGYYSYFSRRGLIDYDMQTIKDIFIQGMDIAAENSEFCEDIDEELSRTGIDIGDEMDEILKYFHKLNDKLEEKMHREKADEIFKCIPMKMEEFYDKFAKECMDKPVLNHYDPYQMFQRITCASNEDIVMIKEMLVDRATKYQDKLEVELEFFKELKQTVDNYSKGKDVSIKMVMLREFSNDLNTIINLYKAPVFTVFGKDKNKPKEIEPTPTVSSLETEIIFDTESMFDDLQDED